MPGFYPVDEYDLAGFAVGIVDREKALSAENVAEGDVIIALPSSGVHSNGFSLVRRILADTYTDLYAKFPELGGKTIGEALIEPTKIYVKPMLALMEEVRVKSVAHITGGGFYENIPRALPAGLSARIERDKVRVLPIFSVLQRLGSVPEREMFNVYNMGVGMVTVVSAGEAEKALEILRANGEDAYVIGSVVAGGDRVQLI